MNERLYKKANCDCYVTDDGKMCAAWSNRIPYAEVIVPCLCDCHDEHAGDPAGKE